MADEPNLAQTVDAHSLVLAVLMGVLLEDRPDLKQRMLTALEAMRKHPNWAAPDKQAALDEAIRGLKTSMPTIQ